MFKKQDGSFSVGKLIGVLALVSVVVIAASACFTSVPAGHTGVVLTFGRVEDNVLRRSALQAAIHAAGHDR